MEKSVDLISRAILKLDFKIFFQKEKNGESPKMIDLKIDLDSIREMTSGDIPLSFHPSFYPVFEKLKKWLTRFSHSDDQSAFSDFFLFYLLATKKFLDHRSYAHLFRLVLSVYHMQKKIIHSATFYPHLRHLEIRWLPTSLFFPFSSKPVLGCLIAFNVMDRYELFDEENVLLALQKYLPELRLVRESSYCHTTNHKNLKLFYFEIEKKNGSSFSLHEQNILKNNLEEKVKNSIQTLSPTIYMGHNEEDVYKNILVLSQEIHSLHDLPQAHIILDQQTGKEIVFRVTLVFISPFHRFSLKQCFVDCAFAPQRNLIVRHLDNHPIEAHIFRLHLPRDASFLRADGSLDFYSARQKITDLIKSAIGEFRDYNGGIIIKQQELLHSLKEKFPEIANDSTELMESFFYAITPLEKQVVLHQDTLANLFKYYLENRKQKLSKTPTFNFETYFNDQQIFVIVHGNHSSIVEAISTVLQEQTYQNQGITYNIVDNEEGVFFNCVLQESEMKQATIFIEILKQALTQWQQKLVQKQTLKIAFEYSVVSLDPRIGGESISGDILRLLFEGLTRYDQNGNIENGVAESIEVSSNGKQYVFKLRTSFWNDGSPVTAYDFEYAWKKILSPGFKTSFANSFYPIKNAKEAKEGKVSPEAIGIEVIDNRTLKVELINPTPYFLQLTADPLFSPVHRFIDQQHPQWSYQCEANYPCNGPFQLKINQPNQGYQFVKNALYWDNKRIELDQITMTQMPPSQATQAFQKNEVDWVGSPFGSWHSLYGVKNEKVTTFKSSTVCWFVFNTNYRPFHNHKLRQAFAYAINRAQIVQNSFMPLTPANSLLLPYYHDYKHCLYPEFSPDKARALLHEALHELDLSLEDLPTITLVFLEKGIREHIAYSLMEQFKECLGIKCELQALPWNRLFNQMTKGNFQVGIVNWLSKIDDPIDILSAFKFADQDINFSKWENKDFINFLDLSDQEISPFLRSSYLLKAEEIVCKDMPIIPILYQPYQALIRKNLNINFKLPSGPFNISRTSYNKEM